MKNVCHNGPRFWVLSLLMLIGMSGANGQSVLPFKEQTNLAIEKQRTLSFSTQKASFMDVDLSPDGSTLLLGFLGGIYTLPVSGGNARQVSSGLATYLQPVWSPDGGYIAYEGDGSGQRAVQVTDTLGNLIRIFKPAKNFGERLNPYWLPDNGQIVAGDEVFHLSGIRGTIPWQGKFPIGFSSDGRYCFLLADIAGKGSKVLKFDRSNHKEQTLFELPMRKDIIVNVRISPNGRWLSYFKFRNQNVDSDALDGLWVFDLILGKESRIANVLIGFPGYISSQHYCFSKDSRYVFISYGGQIHKIDRVSGKDVIIPFIANLKFDYGPMDHKAFDVSLDSLRAKYLRCAKRHPDGKQFVFCAFNKIYRFDAKRNTCRLLADQPLSQFQPAYSPDGRRIAYVTWSDAEGGAVWEIGSENGKPGQLTMDNGFYAQPSWSPDGRFLLFIRGKIIRRLNRDDAGSGDLVLFDLRDRSEKIIAKDVPAFNCPTFSTDGKSVFYQVSPPGGREKALPQLVCRRLDDAGETNVVAVARKDFFAPIRSLSISPDRRYIVLNYNQDLYLYPLIEAKGAAMILDVVNQVDMIRFARGGIDPVWEKGGHLAWTGADGYHRILADKIIEMAIRPKKVERTEKNFIADVYPDKEFVPLEAKMPRFFGMERTALINARIITMQGTEVIEKGTMVIENGRITQIGRSDQIVVPIGAKVMDLYGKTVMPGLIDLHSHMYQAVPSDILIEESWQRKLNLLYGVTTIRDPSGSVDTYGYSELIEAGRALGPRLFTAGNAVRPHFNINNPKEAEIVVGNRIRMGSPVIKQYGLPDRLQRQYLLLASQKAGANMTNEGDYDPLVVLGMVKDGAQGIEHQPIWGEVEDDIITVVAKSGTFFCPTLQACYGKEQAKHYFRKRYGQEFLARSAGLLPELESNNVLEDIKSEKLDSGFLFQARIAARIKNAGGKIVMGSHGEDQGVGAHWEMWALQMGGMSNFEALQTATITAAEGLGMEKDIGSLAAGKIADLIILDKDPLADIHNSTSIRYVMKAGILYDGKTLKKVFATKKH